MRVRCAGVLAAAPTPEAAAKLPKSRIIVLATQKPDASVASQSAHDLGEAAAQAFRTHPDAGIMTSFPGISDITGARVLGELGDDRCRFADARAVKAYAGAAPVTRASGKSRAVNHRRIKNQRLASTGYLWAFSPPSLPRPEPALTTTGAALQETGRLRRNATSSTDSSAASTTASAQASSIPKPQRSTSHKPSRLDTLSASDVSIRYSERLADAGAQPSIGSVGDSFDCEDVGYRQVA